MKESFTTVISAKRKLNFGLKELFKYRHLITLFVQKDFKTKYAQTVLGPLWFIVQPLLTTFIYSFVFGGIAKLSTGNIPRFLFYLAGNIPWIYFSTCITRTANIFAENARLFGKVYFPRLVTPVSHIVTCLLNFLIQFIMFIAVWAIFFINNDAVNITWVASLTPLFIIQAGLLGMGFGLIISSITVRFRDLQVLVGFGVSLLMYATPVVYLAESVKGISDGVYTLVMLNPVSPVIELMRYGWLGVGSLPWAFYGISLGVTLLVLIFGVLLFNKVEKNFVDIV